MRAPFLLLLALVVALGSGACGGGGSESESTEPACQPGGALRRLAYAGGPAPDTGGLFTAFPIEPYMDAAAGGWAAFVGATDDAVRDVVAYVVEPDGTMHLAFAAGDVVPNADGGVIDTIRSVRVNQAGRIVAYVTITGDGGGRTFGLLTRRVTGGVISPAVDLVYSGIAMTATGLSGVLETIDHDPMLLAKDGWTFFVCTTSTGDEGLYRVRDDGGALQLLAGTGTSLPGGAQVWGIEAYCIGPEGSWVAFLCERDDAGFTGGVYAGQIGGGLGEVFVDGEPVSSGVADDFPSGQSMAVDLKGVVLFEVVSSLGADHLCVGAAGFDPTFVAIGGEVEAVWTGAEYRNLAWLNVEPGTSLPMFQATLGPSGSGVSFGLYGVPSLTSPPAIAAYETRPAPTDLGEASRLTSVFPGLTGDGRYDVDVGNALVFANQLTSGRTGVFWLIPGCGFFTVVAGGQDAGGGDTFGGGNGWRATVRSGVIVFRAPLSVAGSGIYRRTFS